LFSTDPGKESLKRPRANSHAYSPQTVAYKIEAIQVRPFSRRRWAMQQEGVEIVIHSFGAWAYEVWRHDIGQADSPTLRAQFVAMA
jgi:hypothetical protein